MGLLIAIRSYRERYTDFQIYMKQCAIRQLDFAKKVHQARYRVESRLSLDQNLPSSVATYKDFFAAKSDVAEDCYMLREFTARLPEALQVVFWWRYFRYPDQEIAVKLSISDQEFSKRIADLQSAWYDYCVDIA
ncbi:MAG: hypothetical protein EOM52_00300 [Clostridia bacterium]|nr:hypothetical protein [Clostridia bacterium]